MLETLNFTVYCSKRRTLCNATFSFLLCTQILLLKNAIFKFVQYRDSSKKTTLTLYLVGCASEHRHIKLHPSQKTKYETRLQTMQTLSLVTLFSLSPVLMSYSSVFCSAYLDCEVLLQFLVLARDKKPGKNLIQCAHIEGQVM